MAYSYIPPAFINYNWLILWPVDHKGDAFLVIRICGVSLAKTFNVRLKDSYAYITTVSALLFHEVC